MNVLQKFYWCPTADVDGFAGANHLTWLSLERRAVSLQPTSLCEESLVRHMSGASKRCGVQAG